MKRSYWYVIGAFALVVIAMGGKKVATTLTEKAKIDALIPPVRDILLRFRQELASNGIKTIVGETYRSPENQAKKVASGLSSPSTLGKGWHTIRRAFHLVPVINGKADIKGTDLETLKKMHKIAVKYGLTSLAFNPDGSKKYITTSKGPVWDAHHFEYRDGLTFAQADSQNKKEGWA